MKRIVLIAFFIFTLTPSAHATTLFSDNWNAQADWSDSQSTSLLTTESGTVGSNWSTVYGSAVGIADGYGKTGKGLRFTITNSGGSTQACCLFGNADWSYSGDSLFWGMNFKTSQVISQTVPLKMTRFYSDPASSGNSIIPEWYGDEWVFFYDGLVHYTSWELSDTDWHAYVFEFQRGNNSNDGVIRMWVDGDLKYEATSVDWDDTGTSFSYEYFPMLQGNMSGSYSGGTFYTYWDDYIWATTKAEVETFLGATSAPDLNTSVISANGTTLTLTFSENISQDSAYNDNHWDLDCSVTGNGIGITYVSGDEGTEHVYTIDSAIDSADVCNIDFDGTTNSMEDDDEEDLEAIVSDSVTNLVPPTLSTSAISSNGTTLTLTFNDSVTQGSGYNNNDWDLDCSVTGNGISVIANSGNGTATHIYTIGSTVQFGEVCNIDFTGDANSMENDNGADLAAIVSDSMTNNSLQGVDITPPEISSATIDTNGTTLTLVFNENVNQGSGYNDNDWNIDCTTEGNDIGITYSSGNEGTTHIYTVAITIGSTSACTLDFTGDSNSMEDDNLNDLAAISSAPDDVVINNSIQGGGSGVICGVSMGGVKLY